MAGYSGTPLPKKLGIKEGSTVAFSGAPPEFEAALGPLPDAVTVKRRPGAPLDVAVAFFTRRVRLERRLPALARAIHPDGGLWIAWPKRSAKIEGDLTFEAVQEVGLAHGLVDNKSCSIDDRWQALRFVYRLTDRTT